MIKNILIDLDDTIFDFKKGERDALTRALRSHGIEPDEEKLLRYNKVNDAHWKMLEKGIITKEELNPMRFRAFFGEYGIDLCAEKFCLEYEGNLANEYFLIDGAEEMLKSLYGRYRLYIASNGYEKTQYSRIEQSGIKKYFEDFFISEEIGFDKPADGFFKAAFSRIPGFRAEETVILGDSLTSDIKGGKNGGITTVWFNRNDNNAADIIPDYEIKSLGEIKMVLDEINGVNI